MRTENFLQNYDLIVNKNENYSIFYYSIETPIKLPINIELAKIIRIYSIEHLRKDLQIEKKKIMRIQKIINTYYL